MPIDNFRINDDLEQELLLSACAGDIREVKLFEELLRLLQSRTLLMNNYGLQNDLENRIEAFIKAEN